MNCKDCKHWEQQPTDEERVGRCTGTRHAWGLKDGIPSTILLYGEKSMSKRAYSFHCLDTFGCVNFEGGKKSDSIMSDIMSTKVSECAVCQHPWSEVIRDDKGIPLCCICGETLAG